MKRLTRKIHWLAIYLMAFASIAIAQNPGPVAADIDADGNAELFFAGDQQILIYQYGQNGWEHTLTLEIVDETPPYPLNDYEEVRYRMHSIPGVGDVNGDGIILFPSGFKRSVT